MAMTASQVRSWLSNRWANATRITRIAIYCALPAEALRLLSNIPVLGRSDLLSAIEGVLWVATFVFVTIGLVRWMIRSLLWRLRNRLFVAYVFIGVVPLALVGLMVALVTILSAGQIAVYATRQRIALDTARLHTATADLRADVASKPTARLDSFTSYAVLQHEFPSAEVKVFPAIDCKPPVIPAWSHGDFSGMVIDHDKLSLRSVQSMSAFCIISSAPVDQLFIDQLANNLGSLEITLVHGIDISHKGQIELNGKKQRGIILSGNIKKTVLVKGGAVRPKRLWWDPKIQYNDALLATDWNSGSKLRVVDPTTGKVGLITLGATIRPSSMYEELFSGSDAFHSGIIKALWIIAGFFGVVELIALFIGVKLTRSITAAVHGLYIGTKHVNRGDFAHRIPFRGRDQLAELEKSFNSMSANIEHLIEEQKEKQRLESELAIAKEVQEQLFPRLDLDSGRVEVFGICKPARSVSGDYYDFIFYGQDALIAMGDISGKGISAALLMASIHSAVRAQDLAAVGSQQALSAGEENDGGVVLSSTLAANGPGPIGNLMGQLNSQLYRSTPASKYATLFLGLIQPERGVLTYCNGGHIPPALISSTGTIQRLTAGGTVVGLFDEMQFEQAQIPVHSGDLLVAFSDGLSEPEHDGVEFSEDRVIGLVAQHRERPLEEIAAVSLAAVEEWIAGEEQPDDMTIVLARVR